MTQEIRTFLLWLGIVASAPLAAADQANTVGPIVQALGAAVVKQDCASVVRLGVPLLLPDPDARLPEKLANATYQVVAFCALQIKRNDVAEAVLERGTKLPGATDDLWKMRLGVELDRKEEAAAVATIEAMTEGRGAAMNAFPISSLGQFQRTLETAGKTGLNKRLLAVLAGPSYAPDGLFNHPDRFKLAYARILVGEGNPDAARVLVGQIVQDWVVITLLLDQQLRPLLPEQPDIRAFATRQLDRDRLAMATHPDVLQAVNAVSYDLRRLGRPAEALSLLNGVEGGLSNPKSFKDFNTQLTWFWDERVRAATQLGNYNDAVDAMRKGAALNENGNPNFSQVINLAALHSQFGHPAEALAVLAVFKDGSRRGSPYGEFMIRSQRGCAYALAGDRKGAADDVANAIAHESDAPTALAGLLVCVGRADDAAMVLIRTLANPNRRADALSELSDYEPTPNVPQLPDDIRRLKLRPDVTAAIDAAGGTLHFNVWNTGS